MSGGGGWVARIPGLAGLDAAGQAELARSLPRRLPAGSVVFAPGAACQAYLLRRAIASARLAAQSADENHVLTIVDKDQQVQKVVLNG